MSQVEKRIEMIRLIQKLKHGDEKPGDTILRALREAVKKQTWPVGGPGVPLGASVSFNEETNPPPRLQTWQEDH